MVASVPLKLAHHPTHVVLDLDCTRSTRSREAIRKFLQYASCYGITNFALAISPLCLPILRRRLAGKVALFIF